MRKNWISLTAIALIVLMAFSLSACGDSETAMEADIVLGASCQYDVPESSEIANTVFSEVGYSDVIDSNIPEVDVPDSIPATVGLRFALNPDRTAYRVVGYNTVGLPAGAVLSSSVYIPYTYLGLPVIDIAHNAFFGADVTSVALPKTLLRISEGAFETSAIASINIPASVLYIEDGAFARCKSLTSITVEEGNSRYSVVSKFLVDGNRLIRGFGEADIDASITEIADYAFSGCEAIETLTIPATVQVIGESVFRECPNLKVVTIEAPIDELPTCTFQDCTALNRVDLPESVTAIGHGAYRASGIISLVIPDTVKSIGSYAFADCGNLEDVDIMEGAITEIGGAAFENCVSLTTLLIPEGVTRIGGHMCMGCTSLSYVSIPSTINMIGSAAFYGCTALESLYVPKSLEYMGTCVAYGASDKFRFKFELGYIPANNKWEGGWNYRYVENGLASNKASIVIHTFKYDLGVENPL